MYLINIYIPKSHLESVKAAMFAAGAGKLGHYEHCCWQTSGQGQFKPLAGSQPYSGELNQLNTEEEYKVEMICTEEHLDAVIKAIKTAHPYETPAFQIIKGETRSDLR